jgi:hypothetical protein
MSSPRFTMQDFENWFSDRADAFAWVRGADVRPHPAGFARSSGMSLHTPFDANRYAEEFHREGFFIREGIFADIDLERLRSAVAEIPNGEEVRRKGGVYGVRNYPRVWSGRIGSARRISGHCGCWPAPRSLCAHSDRPRGYNRTCQQDRAHSGAGDEGAPSVIAASRFPRPKESTGMWRSHQHPC